MISRSLFKYCIYYYHWPWGTAAGRPGGALWRARFWIYSCRITRYWRRYLARFTVRKSRNAAFRPSEYWFGKQAPIYALSYYYIIASHWMNSTLDIKIGMAG